MKVDDYIASQKVIYFFSKGDGKRFMIYVTFETHSPKNSYGKWD